MTASHRNTIFAEDAVILQHQHWPDDQHIIRLAAKQTASLVKAGQFVHLQCDRSLALRRPLSVLSADPDEGSIELLYKVVGEGTRLLAKQETGSTLNLLGPVGNTFSLNSDRPVRILIGGGVGIPPMLFLANQIISEEPDRADSTLVFMGSESAFPFELTKSAIPLQGIEGQLNRSLVTMEESGISSRLASMRPQEGCYQGYVHELVKQHLDALETATLEHAEIFACGPLPMLKSVRDLARSFSLPCQISLEEHMACAVGGCAGCVVRITTGAGDAMKRVCVDGPVFAADTVVFQ